MPKIQVTTPSDREVRTSRDFTAPRGLIWDCHTRPELISKWMLGPPGWTMPVCEIDLRVGGKYRYVLKGPKGEEMGFGGTYTEIVYPERILTQELFDQDWTGGETRNTLVLTEAGGVTTVTQTILYASKAARDGALATPMAEGMEAGYAVMEQVLDQLAAAGAKQKITPFLWFDGKAEEAARFYVSVFGNSKIRSVNPMMTSFEIEGQNFMALNGGPMFKFTEAVSFYIHCNSQAEIDHFWDGLREGGGAESMCGWLKDRYGLSWQVVPEALGSLMGDKDQAKSQRVMQALLKMKKIVIADLVKAHAGEN